MDDSDNCTAAEIIDFETAKVKTKAYDRLRLERLGEEKQANIKKHNDKVIKKYILKRKIVENTIG